MYTYIYNIDHNTKQRISSRHTTIKNQNTTINDDIKANRLKINESTEIADILISRGLTGLYISLYDIILYYIYIYIYI